ncbi:TcpQ domain-containing protein [Neptunomonas phycophila]|uniref:TcpQ domain-containing protein n=1 Tax=Neptunomonas phycophila TaxID=1572645 RepID=UPI003515B274
MKRLILISALLGLTGCVPLQLQTANVEPETIVHTDDLLIMLAPGVVEDALKKVANESGLKLQYDAEGFLHYQKGALTGSAESIALQIVTGHPLRVYQWGDSLIVEQQWKTSTGKTLKQQLQDWDAVSAWHVVWETRQNQNLQAVAEFYGTFDVAVEQLFKSVRNDGSEIEPEFYPNRTVVIR